MKQTLLTLAGAALLLAAQPAFAHGTTKPSHGGITMMAGETLFELVTTPGAIAIYATDDAEPVTAARMSGTMTITAAGKTSTIALKPAAANRFDAPGASIPAGAKVGITLIDTTTQTRLGTVFPTVK